MRWMNSGDFFDALHPPPFRCFHNPRHRSHGNLVRTGYQGGRRCRAVAWRKRGWRLSSEARARFAAPPHRQRPPRGPRRSGKTTGGGDERSTAGRRKANDLAFRARNARSHSGGLGRRHTFTLRGADPAPRFPTASTARRRNPGVATEKPVLKAPSPGSLRAHSVTEPWPCPSGHPTLLSPAIKTGVWNAF